MHLLGVFPDGCVENLVASERVQNVLYVVVWCMHPLWVLSCQMSRYVLCRRNEKQIVYHPKKR